MAMIYVRARPNRRAFHEGKIIPHDKFIPVTDTPQIRRMIDHWGDLEEEGGEGKGKGKGKGKHAHRAEGE